jgi:hypothetical protein
MTATARASWVVCRDYAYGPFTPERAAKRAAQADESGDCRYSHQVVTSGVRPATEAELNTVLAERQAAFLTAEPGDPDWRESTQELAALWLSAPLGTSAHGLTVAGGGWSKEAADRADAAGEPSSPAWYVALGRREHVTLTDDGRSAETSAWCRCSPEPPMDGWVQYQRWTERGQEAHGYVCRKCRHLLQSG